MRIAHSTQHRNAREFGKEFAKGFCSGVAIACACISFAIIPTIAAYVAASGRIFSHAGAAATVAYFILPFTIMGSFIGGFVFKLKLVKNMCKHADVQKPLKSETARRKNVQANTGPLFSEPETSRFPRQGSLARTAT